MSKGWQIAQKEKVKEEIPKTRRGKDLEVKRQELCELKPRGGKSEVVTEKREKKEQE